MSKIALIGQDSCGDCSMKRQAYLRGKKGQERCG